MSDHRIEDAIHKLRDLPTLSTVLTQILKTASDPDSSALDLGRYIAADQSLSATLLKLVNSAYYGFYRRIDSVTNAIVILGFVEVRNLVFAAHALRAFPPRGGGVDRTQLWRHSLATAMAAERASRLIPKPLTSGPFVAGLLHDIGKVALDVMYSEQFRGATAKAKVETRPLKDVELEVFGMDHARVGAMLGEHWNLPAPIVEAIGLHHEPEKCPDDSRLTCVTTLADYLAYKAGLGDTGNGIEPPLPEHVTRVLELSGPQLEHISEHVAEARDHIDELLGIMGNSA